MNWPSSSANLDMQMVVLSRSDNGVKWRSGQEDINIYFGD